jgi:hypothetical protein
VLKTGHSWISSKDKVAPSPLTRRPRIAELVQRMPFSGTAASAGAGTDKPVWRIPFGQAGAGGARRYPLRAGCSSPARSPRARSASLSTCARWKACPEVSPDPLCACGRDIRCGRALAPVPAPVSVAERERAVEPAASLGGRAPATAPPSAYSNAHSPPARSLSRPPRPQRSSATRQHAERCSTRAFSPHRPRARSRRRRHTRRPARRPRWAGAPRWPRFRPRTRLQPILLPCLSDHSPAVRHPAWCETRDVCSVVYVRTSRIHVRRKRSHSVCPIYTESLWL